MTFNLSVILRESARRDPDKTAVIFGDRKVSYAELDAAADRAAAGLLRYARRGDRVALMLPNRVEFLECYFGILKAGLVAVPMNPLLKAAEVDHILTDSGARVLIAGDVSRAAVAHAGVPVLNPDESDFLAADAPLPWAASTDSDDTAVIIYTSGTTGRPKGAELTHFQLYLNCSLAGERFDTRPDDVSLAVLPFFHVYGLSSVVNVVIRKGGTIVAVPKFDVDLVLDALHDHRVSVLAGVPTMYHALLHADLGGRDLSALRIGSCGGASMPEAVLKGVEQRFGITVLEGYGLSETGSTATMNHSVDDRRIRSIGKPIWGVDVRVAGPDGAEQPVGEVGELLVRGHVVMKGYHGDPAATAAAIQDGWLHTGDLGYRDADGFLYVVDRMKDLIIRGGFNVYPREVEEVLYTHPAVAEAAVVGRPDERVGEEIVAVVTVRPGADLDPAEVIAFCRERLADYKSPREVRVRDSLPKSATGKLLKRELRGLVLPRP
ncbi:long-chain fatty acid--CoA ligase [Asanoa sp. WMMD1127]|uniref:long-chain-fatty-acid--CoA ligase n=1 Tax=Asanoa sp. WMMD1127 TaxID=3016107 RepID=UPI0024160346|nr:long-chain fatty acid--CoA ligase [Asanoa sp. WMMD1127]MDG4824834.1 long-chain fatty acid--CoA ligase [Asanoa sp. WMMD1127]